MSTCPNIHDKRGFAAVYAMLVTALLSALLVVGWMMALSLSKNLVETTLFREAHIVASSTLREFMAGAQPTTHEGTFSNGYSYRVVITNEHSLTAGLDRLNCTVLWETEAPLPANAITATNALSLTAARLSP